MDRKARDLESGRKKLEEYKRKKQAKGAALRQQLEAAAAGSGVAPPGDAASGRGGTFASPPRSADATRSKYQERLEAKLASVLGNTTNQAHAHPPASSLDDEDAEHARVDERREKAMHAGMKLSAELDAARADIAAVRDLTQDRKSVV